MSDGTHVLVTGGAGFIGSRLVDALLEMPGVRVTVLDKLTYAGNLDNLAQHDGNDLFTFVRGDIADAAVVEPLVKGTDRVINAAAESFVDRSIADPGDFLRSNIVGTYTMLEACRKLERPMLQVSTDEVYGSTRAGSFAETDPLAPNSPYSATKAGADLLCRAYHRTYDLPVTVVRGSNAYGPRQHPEKVIPTFTLAALDERPIPVYGNGSNRREWLYVGDFVRAILTVFASGEPGGVYNVGGGHEASNVMLARMICGLTGTDESLITFVPDRPGHDLRYALKWEPLSKLGWSPRMAFHVGLRDTVTWFGDHRAWAAALLEAEPSA